MPCRCDQDHGLCFEKVLNIARVALFTYQYRRTESSPVTNFCYEKESTMMWLLAVLMSFNTLIRYHVFDIAGQEKHNLTVTVTQVKVLKGKMIISVYNNPKEFPHYYKEYKMIRVPCTSASVTGTFAGLPEGEYAVSVYQDVNEDDRCNTNIIGYPTEGFGFSNNVKARFSAPSFNACKLLLSRDMEISIALIL
jgi:uncharacterized protein (DUF2141 family)